MHARRGKRMRGWQLERHQPPGAVVARRTERSRRLHFSIAVPKSAAHAHPATSAGKCQGFADRKLQGRRYVVFFKNKIM